MLETATKNNLHKQHHLDQAINNPISSNSQQNRDPFGESNSKFINYQNYNQGQPIPTMHSSETHASFLPGQEKIDYKFSVKLPPIKLPNYDGDPMAYHDWINMFQATVDRNHTISATHRMTYLQDSVSGKAKALIKGYSCNPAFYKAALRDLQNHFGDSNYIVNAFIQQIETWPSSTNNNRSVVSFASFLKQLVRTFQNLGFQADLHSTALLKLIKTEVPDNLLMKWTEYTVVKMFKTTTYICFRSGLKYKLKYWKDYKGSTRFWGRQRSKIRNLRHKIKRLWEVSKTLKWGLTSIRQPNSNILPKSASIVHRNIFWLIAPATRV